MVLRGFIFNGNITADKKAIVIDIMQTMGIVTVVSDEKEIDIIAALVLDLHIIFNLWNIWLMQQSSKV